MNEQTTEATSGITGWIISARHKKNGERSEFWYSPDLENIARRFARELAMTGHAVTVTAQREATWQ